MTLRILSLLVILFLLGNCSDTEPNNHKPTLHITNTIEGLDVTLTGSAHDSDGTIKDLIVDWGDNMINTVVDNFSSIEVSHHYSNPGTYSILATLMDNHGDTALYAHQVTIDFKETSLVGIKESMFKISENEYLILTLNLHTYQEAQQNEKFNLIADFIGKMDIDFIAFQECGQNKSASITEGIIREDNMALIIAALVKEKYAVDYNYVWNWAHYGWTVWEEGVAILSKHPILDSEDRYISSSTSQTAITSRKVIYGTYQVPVGTINIFSAHTHWRTTSTDEEQNNQIKNIKLMVSEKESLAPNAVIFVCGDFNGNPTSDYPWSEGYNTMTQGNEFKDTFLEIYPTANNKPAQSIYNTIGGDFPGRIDYIFTKNNTHFMVVDSQIIFKSDVVGKVSDHYGVLTKVVYTE